MATSMYKYVLHFSVLCVYVLVYLMDTFYRCIGKCTHKFKTYIPFNMHNKKHTHIYKDQKHTHICQDQKRGNGIQAHTEDNYIMTAQEIHSFKKI